MNIEDIRAEIPKALGSSVLCQCEWIKDHDKKDFDASNYYGYEINQNAARILIDLAYEAGKADSKELWIKGFEEGEKAGSSTYDQGYNDGYKAAAKNPKAWWVPDKHGEPVHIDEYVKVDDCDVPMRVIGFSQDENGKMEFVDCEGFQISADECEKVIPDSWEQLHNDIEEYIYMSIDIYDEHGEDREKGDRCAEAGLIADELIARAKALAKVD